MMRSIGIRLFLAFLAVILTGMVLVGVLAGRTTAVEFSHFMFGQNRDTSLSLLASYYAVRGGWAGIEMSPPFVRMGMAPGGPGMGPGGGLALADTEGRIVAPGAGHRIGEKLGRSDLESGTPVEVEGEVVGTLIGGRGAFGRVPPAGEAFLARVNRALLLAGVGATGVALLLGVLLTRSLTRPIRQLTAATRAVAEGDFGRQVSVVSRDELGELAVAFNQMSTDLARARSSRRQMTADIAHELRTPLSVIMGHAEAGRDGVLPASPETFGLIHEEALSLNRVVQDLRMLSLAEAGELSLLRQPVSIAKLLQRAAAAQAPRAGREEISLRMEVDTNGPEIRVDPDRMTQVLGNLLDNALRHTPAGGAVKLAASTAPGIIRITVGDTGPGIPPEDLPHVFERFYRADKSRARDQGGSGLGLPIAKSIVEAHGGRIWAESNPGEGTNIIIEIPL